MKSRVSRRWTIAATVFVAILFLLRPGASRLKSRIATSIGAAVGRSVEIGSVHLRLLPQPGFDLENLVVYDDPAFGSEPLLRAGEVMAVLRLTSLVRGRIEIARLDLIEPSLNLVHGESGRWNLEALLERTARSPFAPTGKSRSEMRPAFPYIEAGSGRINFKFGQEKKPYALINADFSLWQDSENSWGVRLKAQPFRSDLNLSDTGTLRVEGKWQRADSLRETPLQFTTEWDRPQLGQLSKFLTGSDMGWRGAVVLDAILSGTPAKLQISSDAFVRDFRRFDILNGEAVQLGAHCDGQYSSTDQMFRELFCRAPVGNGSITVHGDIGLPGSQEYDVAVTAENVPTGPVAAMAQRIKKNLPDDLVATGTVNANLILREMGDSVTDSRFEGQGEIADLRLVSAGNKADLAIGSVPFLLRSEPATVSGAGVVNPSPFSPKVNRAGVLLPHGARLEFGTVFPGTKSKLSAKGWLSRTGYGFYLTGNGEIERILHLGRLFGLPVLATSAEGTADVDLQIAGPWAGWSATNPTYLQPRVSGSVKLENVRVPIRGTTRPVEISSADVLLVPERVQVSKLTLSAAHSTWTGSVDLPRGCGTPAACLIHFDLSTRAASLGDLRDWIVPRQGNRPWYRVLAPSDRTSQPAFLASLRATGALKADRVVGGRLVATEVSAHVSVDGGKLRISDLRAEILGGTNRGDWQADFTQKPPVYSGSGLLAGIPLERLGEFVNQSRIAGVATGNYEITASGISFGDFWRTADASIQFDVHNGSLGVISLPDDGGPLNAQRFDGVAHLREGVVEIRDAELDSTAGKFRVSGTASLNKQLDFKLKPAGRGNFEAQGKRGYAISGTLTQPKAVILSTPETQARLKP